MKWQVYFLPPIINSQKNPEFLQTNSPTSPPRHLRYSQLCDTTSIITTITMTGTSSVGPISVAGAGDQRNVKDSELEQREPYEEGKVNSHKTDDPKDQRSIANRLAAEERKDEEPEDDKETALSKKDPTLPAKHHGNEPSKGAKIDAELQAEEEETINKKKAGKTDSMPGKKN